MTARKHLKTRIRARMAATGERYVTARRHVVGTEVAQPALDNGYRLRGGVHPDTSAVANVLAHHGVVAGHTGEPLTEAMVLGIGGGLGAGYILWEFKAHESVTLVLGYRNRWQYPARWMRTLLERLTVPAVHHETGGARTAARQLDAALAAGRPALATIDRQSIGSWHLPPELEGHGGYPVVVYAEADGRVHVDDRGLAPLTVDRATLDAARGRVGSYKHRLCVIAPDRAELPADLLRAAVRAGLADAAEHLAATSDSFGLPAWRKWARMMTAPRGAKAWPQVFASGRGLMGALLSTYEGIQPVGLYGGHLRGLYADFLDEAADLLAEPRLTDAAAAWRAAADTWQSLADVVLPAGRLRELLTDVHAAVVEEGDAGAATAAAAAAELWELRGSPPEVEAGELFPAMAELLNEIYERETEAARLWPG
jgi:Butirosin biosynthesis protein H, N-terminal/Domain of unknown function (DUF4872)